MSSTRHRETLPTTEARAKLSQIAAEFEREGVRAEPVTFGSHRRPQGVIIPWELWLEILPAIEDLLDAGVVNGDQRAEPRVGARRWYGSSRRGSGRLLVQP